MWLFSEITINSNLFVVACALLDMEFPISALKTKIQPSGTSEGAVLRHGAGFRDIDIIENKVINITYIFIFNFLEAGEIVRLSDHVLFPGTSQK